MENKELEKNLNRIAQYDKKLADKILMTEFDKSKILVVQNPNGDYNLVYNNYYLHSNEDIAKEVDEIISKIGERNNQNVIRIVYGLGLGYLVDKVSELSGKTIIYEPNIDILKFVFSVATIDAIFKDNVFVCSDKTTLSELILDNSNIDTKMTVNFLPSYLAMFSKDIQDVISTIQVSKGGHNATKNTLLQSSPRAIRNTFANLKNIVKNPDIMQLKDVYKGKTALCLSAGPSLRENIEIIKDNQDKFVIFAVNPTIKLLSQFGVKPDFIVDVESANTSIQFDTINPKDYYFIMEAFANSNVYNLDTKKTFSYISNTNFVNNWVRKILNINYELETKGTVSYSALMSAYIMGFDRIILCGQDLAYKDGRCYAKGSQYEELECVFDENAGKYVIKPKDFDKYAKSFMLPNMDWEACKKSVQKHLNFLNGSIYTVNSQDGRKIPTQTGYAMFIDWFKQASQKMKSEKPDIKLVNSSTGGAMIDGFENIPLSDVVKDLEPVEKLNLVNHQGNYDKNKVKLKVNLLYEKLKIYKDFTSELMELSKKLLKEIKNKKILTPNIQKMINKLNDLTAEMVRAKDDEDLRHIVFFTLCKYSDALQGDCFSDVKQALSTAEKIIEASEEAYYIYIHCLKRLANY